MAPALASCVAAQGSTCYHPGTTWCAAAQEGAAACLHTSLGCYYAILCESACICASWKAVFCGGVVKNLPCPQGLLRILALNTSAQPAPWHDDLEVASLDESLSGKRTCR